MSLTAPGCPVAGEMPGWVQEAVEKVDGVAKAMVELTFDGDAFSGSISGDMGDATITGTKRQGG